MSDHQARPIVDTYLRLILLSLLLFWCLSLIMPFLHVMVWSIILAMAMSPLYNSLLPRFKNKKVLTAAFLVLIGLAIIIIPSLLFVESIIEGVRELKGRFAYYVCNLTSSLPSLYDIICIYFGSNRFSYNYIQYCSRYLFQRLLLLHLFRQ